LVPYDAEAADLDLGLRCRQSRVDHEPQEPALEIRVRDSVSAQHLGELADSMAPPELVQSLLGFIDRDQAEPVGCVDTGLDLAKRPGARQIDEHVERLYNRDRAVRGHRRHLAAARHPNPRVLGVTVLRHRNARPRTIAFEDSPEGGGALM
jgi:hypothetical protein